MKALQYVHNFYKNSLGLYMCFWNWKNMNRDGVPATHTWHWNMQIIPVLNSQFLINIIIEQLNVF
jgi:hypothetical protein